MQHLRYLKTALAAAILSLVPTLCPASYGFRTYQTVLLIDALIRGNYVFTTTGGTAEGNAKANYITVDNCLKLDVLPTVGSRVPAQSPAGFLPSRNWGYVITDVTVDVDGNVKSVQIEASTDGRLNAPAETCVRGWKFSKCTKDNKPTEYLYRQVILFNPKTEETDNTPTDSFAFTGWELKGKPELIKKTAVVPKYPVELRCEHVSGEVDMTILCDETGSVIDVAVNKATDPRLAKSAVDAIYNWRFKPSRSVTGITVPVQFKMPMRFQAPSK
jgi:TonB family protein